jgi:cbb3-type cytochrome oxidase maturation protein
MRTTAVALEMHRRRVAMNVLIYLVPMALMQGLTGLVAFLWSLRSGQYDDVEGAAVRILADDDIDPGA